MELIIPINYIIWDAIRFLAVPERPVTFKKSFESIQFADLYSRTAEGSAGNIFASK